MDILQRVHWLRADIRCLRGLGCCVRRGVSRGAAQIARPDEKCEGMISTF